MPARVGWSSRTSTASPGIESVTPVRIYRFRAGRLVAVTREFDALVRESERETWRIARKLWQMGGNPHTALAAWAATKYLLGEGSEVWPRLQRLIGARTIEPNLERNGPPYLRSVRSALREFGYLSLPQAGSRRWRRSPSSVPARRCSRRT